MRITAISGYVALRVRERRFLGLWTRLQNIIILDRKTGEFSIPVNHILRNGLPNKFTPVDFIKLSAFRIIDPKVDIPTKPIRIFEAKTAEMYDDHIDLLVRALIENGCCRENNSFADVRSLYRQ